ncbi:MAG TPA: alpha-amylase family glycosyl hydrolase [Ignavibacteriales bacterium]|nr:alpha-amylase family glycosyl hydrolase [Ignavibacteriales bacterium]HOL80889.1 alpha-amylase family glycosyl hydrolase [Ignavibacteriales bacterium]HOM65913.1 alpha-amylase family glycosyl hydrolase [Ignavibacteriales bacterium]HPD67973.1 alpha-amylase family glycosyl hydrolase [Ignavibacteriales bacterium]HPP33324.1 alpha-amylase family glycosyl hydrolase [Ignavibacteriales bacterium]
MKKLQLLLFFIVSSIFAQVVTVTPSFPTDKDSLTIIFNAAEGTKGLMGYTGDVYVHIGVITDKSTSSSDWKYVKAAWNVNLPECKLTPLGNNLWSLYIKPNIRAFLNVPSSEKILKIAMVFRSADGTKEGKDVGGKDIFYNIYEEGLQISFVKPNTKHNIVKLNQNFEIKVKAKLATSIKLYENNNLVQTVNVDSLSYTFVANQTGKFYIKAVATDNNNNTLADSVYYVVPQNLSTQDLPAGVEDGINYYPDDPTKVTFVLVAPYKDNVFVIGDFYNNRWEIEPANQMRLTPDGKRWWITITGLTSQKEYLMQYLVDGNIRICDPYSEKILSPYDDDEIIQKGIYPNLQPYPKQYTSEMITCFQTNKPKYQWQVTNFQRPNPEKLVIYELHLRDFIAEHTYQKLIDTLNYLKTLGINAIELMPITEFEGNRSWGYNPVLYFAPDKYYGPANDLKKFIDECHKNGIAVILDMVYNHNFGQSPLVRLYNEGTYGKPTALNPWFNVEPKHPFNVGYDFNHESQFTQYLIDRANKYWLEEYKIDGYRYDLSKGFTQNFSNDVGTWGQYDAGRIALLKRMYNEVRKYDQTAYMILEHFAENSEEIELANHGFMLWGNLNYEYNEASMGWNNNSDFSKVLAVHRGWSKNHLVSYMESHDEERLMYKNIQYGNASGNYNIKNLAIALDRQKLVGAFFFLLPGPKMLWQFGELGYDYSIDFNGRTGDKPIKWEYYTSPDRNKLYHTWKELIKLKTQNSIFSNITNISYQFNGATKSYKLTSSDSTKIYVVGNFDVTNKDVTINFDATGKYYSVFEQDSITINNNSYQIALEPGKFKVYSTKYIKIDLAKIVSNEFYQNIKVTDFKLEQNYPNPFNPTTRISFSLPFSTNVKLTVYDVTGREIKTLLEGYKNSGTYTVDFDASDLTSGVYFYKLITPNYNATKKMILVK